MGIQIYKSHQHSFNRINMKITWFFFLSLFLTLGACRGPQSSNTKKVDVLIIGGGASGSMAGIQSARMGSETLIAEKGPWLGGMLTSAGVSAIDGNHKLHSGLWAEFRQKLYDYYGGPDSVSTGWVSHVLFEPSVGANILKSMADAEPNLELSFNTSLVSLEKNEEGWTVLVDGPRGNQTIQTKVIIDGTELGDVAAMAGIPYDVGMDSRYETGEEIAPKESNDIVQDLTYVAVLKDYGEGADKTIKKPENYDPSPFFCTCAHECDEDTAGNKLWDCDYMMEYGRLPNDKFMINWPIRGNDYYVNVVEMGPEERAEALTNAKWFTKCYIYYLQTELGFKNLGIADDEFPTSDGFPLIAYHRESRRIKGKVRFTVNDLARPFSQETSLYRTGIAVGDYPIDHHHSRYPDQSQVPDLHFYPVPSYTLPLGALIPKDTENFIVAEKSISVTNIVNGTTRLQPVCMLIGQAAGTLASLAVQQGVTPADVPVRQVQSHLIADGAYIMPYSDVNVEKKYWEDVQKIGATGILKGEGKNIGWSNVTLFYPDSVMTANALRDGLKDIAPGFNFNSHEEILTIEEGVNTAFSLSRYMNPNIQPEISNEDISMIWQEMGWGEMQPHVSITRAQMAVLLNRIVEPFSSVEVDLQGLYKKEKKNLSFNKSLALRRFI
ncbi:FAD dependent oxidoreductase [Marinilabilia salmonicolor]|nr:FAD dependent oxidoreductase [Marinilabilia salmonicolor]